MYNYYNDIFISPAERDALTIAEQACNYAFLRRQNYPAMPEQMDMIGKGLIVELQDTLTAVKERFPKPTDEQLKSLEQYHARYRQVWPSLKEYYLQNLKVIVVGSASTLLGKGLGALIDEYDLVIRVNWFDPSYSDDCGSKFSVLATNATANNLAYIKKVDDSRPPVNAVPDAIWMLRPHPLVDHYVKNRWGTDLVLNAYNQNDYNGGIKAIEVAALVFGQVDIAGFTLDAETAAHYYDGDTSMIGEISVYANNSSDINRLLERGKIGKVLDYDS